MKAIIFLLTVIPMTAPMAQECIQEKRDSLELFLEKEKQAEEDSKLVKTDDILSEQADCFGGPPSYSFYRHFLTDISSGCVTMEDGSVWTVNPFDLPKMANWGVRDPILLMQNSCWFAASTYIYKIRNLNAGSEVFVNLTSGPSPDSPHALFIKSFKEEEEIHVYHVPCYSSDGRYESEVSTVEKVRYHAIVLSDRSLWWVKGPEGELYTWFENDPVIVGKNGSWSSGQTILINSKTGRYLRVK